jgi:hypothetical protein
MPRYPIRLDGLLAKVETTYGADAAPTPSADGVRLVSRLWPGIGYAYRWANERDEVASGGLIAPPPALPAGRVYTLEFGTEVKGAGSQYSSSVKPEVDALLQTCGLSSTLLGVPPNLYYEYQPLDTGHKSATLYGYAASELHKVVGARGSFVWSARAGQLSEFRFRMQGIGAADPAAAALPPITYQAQIPIPATAMTVTVGGVTLDAEEAEFDVGARVIEGPSAAAADGIAEFAIVEFAPTFRAVFPTIALGTYNPYADFTNRASRTINFHLNDVQFNRVKLAIPSAYVSGIAMRDLAGATGVEVQYRVAGAAPVFTLTFD